MPTPSSHLQAVSRWSARSSTVGGPGRVSPSDSKSTGAPNQTPVRTERRIIGLRVTRRCGPLRIADHLGLPQSTVSKVLSRYKVPLLGHIDMSTGVRVRKPKPVRYKHEHPGDLVRVDVKKLGHIPDGGGWRILGRQQGKKNRSGVGYSFLHSAIDDHSRVVYSEILDDERQETAAGFWRRANTYSASLGITVQRVLTDNGSCYRSRLFNAALGDTVQYQYTRPYRPQTNEKIERFHRTLALERAYSRHYDLDTAREGTYQAWIHDYNHHRPHTALGGHSPIDRVHNANGKNT